MRTYAVAVGQETFRTVVKGGPVTLSIEVEGTPHTVEVRPWCGRTHIRLLVDGVPHHVIVSAQGEARIVVVGADRYLVHVASDLPASRRTPLATPSTLEITAPMPGVIVSVEVVPGMHVEQGGLVAIIEAMKMQMEIHAPTPGRVRTVHVRTGDDVVRGTLLVTVDPVDQ